MTEFPAGYKVLPDPGPNSGRDGIKSRIFGTGTGRELGRERKSKVFTIRSYMYSQKHTRCQRTLI